MIICMRNKENNTVYMSQLNAPGALITHLRLNIRTCKILISVVTPAVRGKTQNRQDPVLWYTYSLVVWCFCNVSINPLWS